MKVVIITVTTVVKIMIIIIIIIKLRILKKKERIWKRRKKDGEIYTVKFNIFDAISFYLMKLEVFEYFCMFFNTINNFYFLVWFCFNHGLFLSSEIWLLFVDKFLFPYFSASTNPQVKPGKRGKTGYHFTDEMVSLI